MAAVTLLGSATFDTASGTKTVTAAPANNDLIVIVAMHSGNDFSATPTDDDGGTYTLITSAFVGSASTFKIAVYIRDSLITTAASTVFTHAPGTTTGGGLAVLKVTGMTRVGANAAKQSAKQDDQAASGTPAPVFGAAPLTGNPVIGAVANRSNPAALTPRTNFTELVDTGWDTPTSGIEIMSRDSGETATRQTWGGTSASAFGSIVVELDTSASGTTYNETLSETATPGDSYAFGGFFKDPPPGALALSTAAAPGTLVLTPAATPPNVSLS